MRREYFGLLGGMYSDRELARIIVIASERRLALRDFLHGRRSLEDLAIVLESVGQERNDGLVRKESLLLVHLPSVRQVLSGKQVRSHAMAALRDGLPDLWDRLFKFSFPSYALRVSSTAEIDRQWLAGVLSNEPKISSVVFHTTRRNAGRWNWPLTIGIPDTEKGRELHASLANGKYGSLYDEVLLASAVDAVDLLLLPGSLDTANTVNKRGEVVADAVLVLGGADITPSDANRHLSSLMSRYSAGLSGVCFVPKGERRAWLQSLVREMSHNSTLPGAAFAAASHALRKDEGGGNVEGDLSVPLLLGDAAFVHSTLISDAAVRLGKALMQGDKADNRVEVKNDLIGNMPIETVGQLGKRIVDNVEQFSWLSEHGDATNLVDLRKAIEEQVGPIGIEQWRARDYLEREAAQREDQSYRYKRLRPEYGNRPGTERTHEAPTSTMPKDDVVPKTSDTRHIQAELTSLLQRDAAPTKQLTSNSDYRLRVHIGSPKGGAVVAAPVPIDESSLPDSPRGNDLRIVYCPLSSAPDGKSSESIPSPTQAIVHLPASGDSTYAEFVLRVGARPDKYRARLIATFENRVLQTLILRGHSDLHELVIEEENIYSATFGEVCPAKRPELTFVVNDTTTGSASVTTLLLDAATYVEPPGLKRSIEAIRKLLSDSNVKAVGTKKPKLDSERIVDLLIQLANHGAAIAFELRQQNPVAVFDTAERVQVVEALQTAYLPVEFFYSGKAPRATAKLCPKAVAALDDDSNDVHRSCPNRKDAGFVCPASFWGFNRCIERFAARPPGAQPVVEPEPGKDRLGPFQSALLAASKNASRAMKGDRGVPKVVGGVIPKVEQANSWANWIAQVESLHPELMLLMPHSDVSPTIVDMPALEVSGDWLENSVVDEDYVSPTGSAAVRPLVLLLGCSTHLPDIEYLNFVKKFFQLGAPVVLGTLATVHATQASLVACTLVQSVTDQAGADARFDSVLLRVKRRLLAEGHDVSIGLIAYGHSSWRI